MLLALKVVVQPGKGNLRRSADIANRGSLKTVFGENPSRNVQYVLEFGLEIPGNGERGRHWGLSNARSTNVVCAHLACQAWICSEPLPSASPRPSRQPSCRGWRL